MAEKNNGKRKSTIYFKHSVEEIIDNQTKQAIKSIMGTVDATVEPEVSNSAKRKVIRKVILDNINDLKRVCMRAVDSIMVNK